MEVSFSLCTRLNLSRSIHATSNAVVGDALAADSCRTASTRAVADYANSSTQQPLRRNTARSGKLYRARSRLYRSHILQENFGLIRRPPRSTQCNPLHSSVSSFFVKILPKCLQKKEKKMFAKSCKILQIQSNSAKLAR